MSEPTAIQRLRDAELIVTPIEEGFQSGGFYIENPNEFVGNRREFKNVRGNLAIASAPNGVIYPSDGKWIFEVWHSFGSGPGPGEFRNIFETLDDAVADALDYYFGDPSRMNPPDFLHAMATGNTSNHFRRSPGPNAIATDAQESEYSSVSFAACIITK